METILATRAANPLVVIDDVEKAGDATSDSGISHGMANGLLPLLERSTAAVWSCLYFRVRFDMSWVGWVLTANTTDGLPGPLLSQVPPLHLPDLSREQLIAFARREAARRALQEEVADDIVAILKRLSDRDRPRLRTIVRMVERAAAVHAMPVLH